MSEVTRILNAIEQGNERDTDKLLPLVYEELRLLAVKKLSQEQPGQTLQATALVHEAYIRLVGDESTGWDGPVISLLPQQRRCGGSSLKARGGRDPKNAEGTWGKVTYEVTYGVTSQLLTIDTLSVCHNMLACQDHCELSIRVPSTTLSIVVSGKRRSLMMIVTGSVSYPVLRGWPPYLAFACMPTA